MSSKLTYEVSESSLIETVHKLYFFLLGDKSTIIDPISDPFKQYFASAIDMLLKKPSKSYVFVYGNNWTIIDLFTDQFQIVQYFVSAGMLMHSVDVVLVYIQPFQTWLFELKTVK